MFEVLGIHIALSLWWDKMEWFVVLIDRGKLLFPTSIISTRLSIWVSGALNFISFVGFYSSYCQRPEQRLGLWRIVTRRLCNGGWPCLSSISGRTAPSTTTRSLTRKHHSRKEESQQQLSRHVGSHQRCSSRTSHPLDDQQQIFPIPRRKTRIRASSRICHSSQLIQKAIRKTSAFIIS